MDELPMDIPDHSHDHGLSGLHALTPKASDDELELYDLDDPIAVDDIHHDIGLLHDPLAIDDDPMDATVHTAVDNDGSELTPETPDEHDGGVLQVDHDQSDGVHGSIDDGPDDSSDDSPDDGPHEDLLDDRIHLPLPNHIELTEPGHGDGHDAVFDDDGVDTSDPIDVDGSDAIDDLWPLVDHGVCDPSLVTHLAASLGAPLDFDDVAALVDDAVQADPDLAAGLDARTTVRLLHDAGVQAGLEYGSVETLADHLRSGRSVVLGMGDDDGLTHITAIDQDDQTVTYLSPEGTTSTAPLHDLLDAWENAASEMLLADGLNPSAEGFVVTLDAPGITVLPIPPPLMSGP